MSVEERQIYPIASPFDQKQASSYPQQGCLFCSSPKTREGKWLSSFSYTPPPAYMSAYWKHPI